MQSPLFAWTLSTVRNSNLKLYIAPSSLVIFAILVLLIPLKWLAAWIIAVFVHEIFHYLALTAGKQTIDSISINIYGVKISTCPLTNLQTIICAFAGPAGGLLLLFFSKLYPQLALCALIQSVYNLLPIYPLDGGRILFAFTHFIFSQSTADCICKVITITVITIILIFSIFTSIVFVTVTPLLIPAILFLQQRRK